MAEHRARHPFAEAYEDSGERAQLCRWSGAAAFTVRGAVISRALAVKARGRGSSRGPCGGARGVTNAADEAPHTRAKVAPATLNGARRRVARFQDRNFQPFRRCSSERAAAAQRLADGASRGTCAVRLHHSCCRRARERHLLPLTLHRIGARAQKAHSAQHACGGHEHRRRRVAATRERATASRKLSRATRTPRTTRIALFFILRRLRAAQSALLFLTHAGARSL